MVIAPVTPPTNEPRVPPTYERPRPKVGVEVPVYASAVPAEFE